MGIVAGWQALVLKLTVGRPRPGPAKGLLFAVFVAITWFHLRLICTFGAKRPQLALYKGQLSS